MGFQSKSWLQVGFYSYRSVFIVTGWFLKLQVGFSWFQVVFHVFYGSRSDFHDSRWIVIVIYGPRLVKSKLSAAGAK